MIGDSLSIGCRMTTVKMTSGESNYGEKVYPDEALSDRQVERRPKSG